LPSKESRDAPVSGHGLDAVRAQRVQVDLPSVREPQGLPPADRVEAEGCGNPQGCADAVADDDQPSLSGALLMVVQGFR
jgi:hypothetical protein